MKIIKLIWLPLLIIVFIVILYSFFSDFKKLSKIAVVLPEKKNLYNDIFAKDSSMVPFLTYISNPKIFPIQSYIYKDSSDVLLFPIKNLNIYEEKLPISSLVSFIRISKPIGLINDQLYDGSFKNRDIRFFSLIDTVNIKKKFKIYYTGNITTTPIIKENMLSYSLLTNSLQISTVGSNKILFYVKDRNKIMNIKMSMETTFFKKDKLLYAIFSFPSNNVILNKHMSIINLIKI